MRRRLAIVGFLAAVLVAGYLFVVRDDAVAPRLAPIGATAVIGSGDDAVGVAPDGRILVGLPPPDSGSVPSLPLDEAPEGGRLRGPALDQAKILGAAPAPLRPYLDSSRIGESGVTVVLRGGIELRFGDATDAARKWKAAAALLADPGTTELGYVDVQSPSRPSVGGSGYVLPSAP